MTAITDPRDAARDLRATLAQCTGSSQLFKHPFSPFCTYTEGVREFAKSAGGGAYWLLDILLLEPAIIRAMREHGIVFATLTVADNCTALLSVVRDSGEAPLYQQRIPYTDCPPGDWKFYFSNQVLMLPSEY